MTLIQVKMLYICTCVYMDFYIYTHKFSEKSEFYICHYSRFVIIEQIRCVTIREEDLFGNGLQNIFPNLQASL